MTKVQWTVLMKVCLQVKYESVIIYINGVAQ